MTGPRKYSHRVNPESRLPTRRARKKQRTRDAIEEAALALFERQGFRETTVLQIAEAADVAASTFFLHFPTKEDLVFAGHQVEADALIACLERPNRRTLDALRDYFQSARSRGDRDLWPRRAAIINSTPALSQEERSRWADFVRPAFIDSYADDLDEEPPLTGTRMLAAMTVAGMVELGRVDAEGGDVHATAELLLEQLELLYAAALDRSERQARAGST